MSTNPENLPAVVEVLPPAMLPAAVQQLNALHEQVNAALDRAWQTGVVLGMQLCRLKDALPHGEFGKLFGEANSHHGANFSPLKTDTCVRFEFTDRHARRYMELYRSCLEAAGRLERGEAVAQMLEGYRAAFALEHDRKGELMRRHAARALSRELTLLAPQAHSMRQALFAFAEPAEPAAPNFSERNTKGRVKHEPDDAALRASVTAELDELRGKLDELIESGRYTLATAESRSALEVTLRALLNKFKEVRA